MDIRVRRGGGWSRWQHLGVHGAGGSDPVWVGRARVVQYRLSRRVPGLRLHFVSVARPRVRAGAAQASTPHSPTSRARSGAPTSVRRATAPSYGPVKAVAVHHTVSLNDYTPEEAPQIVLAICRYHRNSNGWNDIGYNALVDKYGTIYEGRAGGLDQAVIGAQAQGFNAQTAGVANIGDYTSTGASDAALAATADYIRWKLTVHGQPLSGPVTLTSAGGPESRYSAGTKVTVDRVLGHRDVGKTACPGDGLYAQLDQIRSLVVSGTPFATAAHVSAALADYTAELPGGRARQRDRSRAGRQPAGRPAGGPAGELGRGLAHVRRLVTGADGTFLSDIRPAKRMYVRVRFPGNADVRPASSPASPSEAAPTRDPHQGAAHRVAREARVGEGPRGAAQARRQRDLPAADRFPLAHRRPPCGAHSTRALRDVVRAGIQGELPLLRGREVRPGHGPGRHQAGRAAGALTQANGRGEGVAAGNDPV